LALKDVFKKRQIVFYNRLWQNIGGFYNDLLLTNLKIKRSNWIEKFSLVFTVIFLMLLGDWVYNWNYTFFFDFVNSPALRAADAIFNYMDIALIVAVYPVLVLRSKFWAYISIVIATNSLIHYIGLNQLFPMDFVLQSFKDKVYLIKWALNLFILAPIQLKLLYVWAE